MAKRKSNVGTCAYCGAYGRVTEDHVVPQGLFGKPRPSDIPKVLACPNCNHKVKSADDNYVRDILAIDMRHAEHPVAQANFEKLLRSAQNGHSTLAKSILQAQLTEFYLPGGLYIGRAYQVPIDEKRLRRFMTTIARGLYFHHFRQALPNDELYHGNFWLDSDQAANLASAFSVANSPHVQVGDGSVFEYMYNMVPDDPLKSFWIFNFYRHSIWTVGTRGLYSELPKAPGEPGLTANTN